MHKKILRTLVCMLLIAALLPVTAFADSGTVTGNDVNMRSGPGTGYRVVDTLPYGAQVTVTDRSDGSWYAISYNGKSGYMASRYISLEESSYPATVLEDSDSASTGYVTADFVRFRSGPSSSNSVIATYTAGKAVTITGSSGGWIACIIDGQAGYVYGDYVSTEAPVSYNAVVQQDPYLDTGAQALPSGNGQLITGSYYDAEEDSSTPAPAANGNATFILDGQTPAAQAPAQQVPAAQAPASQAEVPAAEPAATPAPVEVPTGTEGYISADFVSFRSGPSNSNSILASFNRGMPVLVTGSTGDWLACTIMGLQGYVHKQYVTADLSSLNAPAVQEAHEPQAEVPAAQAPVQEVPAETAAPQIPEVSVGVPAAEAPASSQQGYITGNNVRMRSGASTSSQVLKELFYGNVVTITGSANGWTSIIYDGKVGYVYSDYVTEGSLSGTVSGGSATGRQIADYALQFVGYSYCWGGKSPATGFDCSGLMHYVYSQFGYTLNRVAADQASNGVHVDPSDLQPGDLLCFYSGGSYIGHVGMYIGNNMFVHAATSSTGVITEPLDGYYASRGFEARRIVTS